MARALTFIFCDLSGYTALSEAHGDETAADVASTLVGMARAALQPTARLVKSVGDAVMLVADERTDAMRTALALFEAISGERRFPAARIGLHHGEAVERGGDFFGSAVNVAARVAAVGAAGDLLMTHSLVAAAEACGLSVTALGRTALKNVTEPVELFRARLDPLRGEEAIDPICRMRVRVAEAQITAARGERTHYFCSEGCRASFLARV